MKRSDDSAADDWLKDEQLEIEILEDTGLEGQSLLNSNHMAEWAFSGGAAQPLAALRAIEIAREELLLRKALEEFPHDWSREERQTNHGQH